MEFSQDEINNIFNNEIPLMGLLITSPAAYRDVSDILQKEIFYFPANKILYEAIATVSEEHPDYQMSTIYNYLVTNKLLDRIILKDKVGTEYIEYLTENVGYHKETKTYLDVLIKYAKKAKLSSLISEAEKDISSTKDINQVINELQVKLINIDISESNAQYESIHEVATQSIDTIRKRSRNKLPSGLRFGFEPLDDLTLGYNPGDLIILAARPSMGKTAFALNIAANVAKDKKTVLFFSLEMTNVQLVERILAFQTMINLSSLRSGNLDTVQWPEIDYASDKLKNWQMFLNDKSSLNISDLMALCRRFNQSKKVDLVVIDYLQLISDSKTASDNRQLEVSKISRSLKQLAREMQCPVLALSQLSRRVESREDKQPMLSDLRESGTIEQDADSVIFLYRPDYYNKKVDPRAAETQENSQNNSNSDWDNSIREISTTNVIVAKNRNGATGVVKLGFIPAVNKFIYEKSDK